MTSPKFKNGIGKKIECLGNLKESILKIFARSLLCFMSKKDCKIKYGFEDSISNVTLSSASNQLINVALSETLVLLNHLSNITRN